MIEGIESSSSAKVIFDLSLSISSNLQWSFSLDLKLNWIVSNNKIDRMLWRRNKFLKDSPLSFKWHWRNLLIRFHICILLWFLSQRFYHLRGSHRENDVNINLFLNRLFYHILYYFTMQFQHLHRCFYLYTFQQRFEKIPSKPELRQ